MLVLICLIGLVVGSTIVYKNSWQLQDVAGMVGLVSTIFLGLYLFLGMITYYSNKSDIEEFKATKITIEVARNNNYPVESFELQREIIKSNGWLASTKYWKTTMFEIFVPDEINQLTPIQ